MNLDALLFHAVNSNGQPLLDPLMTGFSAPVLVVPLALAAFIIQVRGQGWCAALRTAALVAMAVVLSDTTSHLLKVLVERVRPCDAFDAVRLLRPCPSSLSMPSAHAANSTAAATVWGLALTGPARWLAFGIAGLVCLSRVYLGVHYPSDVIVGAGIGFAWGFPLYTWGGGKAR
jgi:undecaprenyl-diphosphatase